MVERVAGDHGVGVASTTEAPFGVYLIETAQELDDYCANLQARGLSVLRRAALLKKVHLPELLGQLALESR